MDGDTRLVLVGLDLGAFHDDLGNTVEERWLFYAVGLPGQHPVAMLDSGGYEQGDLRPLANSCAYLDVVRRG